ncbi:HipA family kinase [Yersinia frederiksenii]|uniref:HipA family kinase n=1 Tax=Yersinia frederiksenii TaxID=29484 RepID=UPI0005DFD303|nr:HipA family kinase [Yersinia frederiksenii]CNG80298.1 Uncharacterised protein [Yersinia frederiksenii]
MDNRILKVKEFVRRIPEGSTRPFLCKCEDGELYVVKGMPNLPRKELMAEWIAGCLAKALGLSIPDFKIVEVDQSLVEFVPDLKGELSPGYAFATKFISGAGAITLQQAHSSVETPHQKRIYLFDRWIKNSDRTLSARGGNINIIFDYFNSRHYLIDHNLAFDHDEAEADVKMHVYSPQHRSWIFDIVDRQECEDEIELARKILAECIAEIPEEWKLEEPDENDLFISYIEDILARTSNEVFWSQIT